MATVVLWAIDRFTGPRFPVVAVLPATAEASRAVVAAEFDRALRTWLGRQEQIQVLARAAIAAQPANPFPYSHYEFGARWLVEAGLQESLGRRLSLWRWWMRALASWRCSTRNERRRARPTNNCFRTMLERR
jgi:hypothetical protein